jgi:hypothetical protein
VFAAAVISAIAFPLLWLIVTAALFGLRSSTSVAAQLAHSLVFLAGVAVVLGPPARIPYSRATLRRFGIATAALALPVAISLAHLPGIIIQRKAALAALIAGAAVEELVFRRLIPNRCSALLASRFAGEWPRLTGYLAAQVVFALCHGVQSLLVAAPGPSGLELTRLAASGLLLQSVQLLFGLGAAIGIHAAINITLVLGTRFPSASPEWATVAPLLVGGLLLLYQADHIRRRESAASSPPFGRSEVL